VATFFAVSTTTQEKGGHKKEKKTDGGGRADRHSLKNVPWKEPCRQVEKRHHTHRRHISIGDLAGARNEFARGGKIKKAMRLSKGQKIMVREIVDNQR